MPNNVSKLILWCLPVLSQCRRQSEETTPSLLTLQLVVVRVCGEEDVREEFLEAVAGIAWPVLHVGPDRLVELHEELLGWRAQLFYHFVPLVDIFWVRPLRKTLHRLGTKGMGGVLGIGKHLGGTRC